MENIKSKEGVYLTQKTINNESERIFVTEISGMNVDINDWRDATQSEKDEYELKNIDYEIL